MESININVKHFIYKNYWWFLLLTIAISISCIYLYEIVLKAAMPLLVTQLSIFYFLQKQQLEETKLFREIFSECNERYYSINKALEEIRSKNKQDKLNDKDKKILVNYFNLCGEEYIYYKRGYIYPSVWKSWHNGMRDYMKDNTIKSFWLEESKSNSYYGLKM